MSAAGGTPLPQRMADIDALIGEIEGLPDAAARGRARAIVAAVLDLHAAALARMLEIARTGAAGPSLLDALAGDELVASLLLLHGLHPVPLEARVRATVERLRAEGSDVELVAVEDTTVRLRLRGDSGVPARARRAVVETAIVEAAPDADAIEIEDGGDLGLVQWVRRQPASSGPGG